MRKPAYKNRDAILKIMGFILIVVLASFLRLWALTSYPAGFNADEAAIGYNAWSILHTGKDEFGNPFPIAFTSFGDYKPPLYFYITVPFVAVLGLSEWAVRLPSALLGIATVVLVFFLVQKLFKNDFLSLVSCLFLAISPWHLHYSRGGWETNLATFLLVLGVYLFLKALENHKFWIPTSLAFAFSFYAYQATRVLMPLLVLGLLIFAFRKILEVKRQVILAGIIGIILILPALSTFLGGGGTARFRGVSIFADLGPFWQINEARGEHQDGRIFHNKLQAYGTLFLKNYLEHFSGDFLFIRGDPIPRNNVPDMGVLYLFDLPFLILGVYFLISKKEKFANLLFIWLLIAPVASALTFQSPQALRALNMVIPITIISAYGFFQTTKIFYKRKVFFVPFLLFSFAFLIFNFSHYLHQYYVHNPKHQPIAFEYGFRELVPYIFGVKDKYDQIIVSDRYDQPYILFLFYSGYPPEKFQKEARLTPRDKFGFSTVTSFDKFRFERIDFEKYSQIGNILLVMTDESFPESVAVEKIIPFPNGQPAFKILKR